MTVPRRSLLLGVPVAVAALAYPAVATARTTVDVRAFGAVGDGAADDSDAIAAAVATLTPGSTLYFPAGQYRCARQYAPGGAAIALTGLSDVEVQFAADAELVMDNVDATTSTGTGHGIVIRGPASNVSLRDVSIRWARPSKRSVGDGIRIVGYPTGRSSAPTGWAGPSAPVRGVTLTGCRISSCPQAGVIMMGVSDIEVIGLRVRDSRGDGLHFNACQRARVDDYTGVNTGDDGLALVTYYTEDFAFDAAAETFSFPALTEWSNSGFTVTNVTVQDGQANGVRLSGASGASITTLVASGMRAGAGVMVDSASTGSDAAWFYVASRGIRLHGISVRDCEFGLHLLARPDATQDRMFTDFEVYVSDATMLDCSNWGMRAESLTDVRMTGLRIDVCSVVASATSGGNGGVGLGDADDVSLGYLTVRHQHPVVAVETHNSAGLSVDDVHVVIAERDAEPDASPCMNIDESQGVFGAITVTWPAALDSWHPIRVTNHGVGCGSGTGPPPVAIRALRVVPDSVREPVTKC